MITCSKSLPEQALSTRWPWALGPFAGKVAIGGGNHTDIDGDFLMTPQGSDCPLLKHAEQFCLRVAFQFPDFIQEDGATVGREMRPGPSTRRR